MHILQLIPHLAPWDHIVHHHLFDQRGHDAGPLGGRQDAGSQPQGCRRLTRTQRGQPAALAAAVHELAADTDGELSRQRVEHHLVAPADLLIAHQHGQEVGLVVLIAATHGGEERVLCFGPLHLVIVPKHTHPLLLIRIAVHLHVLVPLVTDTGLQDLGRLAQHRHGRHEPPALVARPTERSEANTRCSVHHAPLHEECLALRPELGHRDPLQEVEDLVKRLEL
mmetsp:Transcript_14019/g.31665  ORF Transcript_14019/g.31665 Transcript_14019/m.31665 type:complete len:224 (-) Transcript_14019:254-925(-)